MPDLYACHANYGARWIEVKHPQQYSFTRAQRTRFLELGSKGIHIWVLTGYEEQDYVKLMQRANLDLYWKD